MTDSPALCFSLPHSFTQQELDIFLVSAFDARASDITFQPGQPVIAEIHGKLVPITDRILKDNDVRAVISLLYGSSAMANIMGGTDLDHRYDIQRDRQNRLGFRVNATPGHIPGGIGCQITMRTIPGLPPSLADLGVEPEIIEAINPIQGMVLVVGVTGSGKSTTLAGAMREKLETGHDRKIITFEAPIEFIYDKVKSLSSIIWQTEVPTHLRHEEGFAYCVRNALRRKPSDILIGEARDRETILALIEASLTGHTTYSTVHADSVAKTISRMILKFPEDSRASVAYDLINVLQLIVAQRLVPNLGGKRTALREYFIFTKEVRDQLLDLPYEQIPKVLDKMVYAGGTSMFHAAEKAFKAGIIGQDIYKRFALSVGVTS